MVFLTFCTNAGLMPKSSVADTRNQLGQDIDTGDVLLSNADFWDLLGYQTLIDGKLLSRFRERGFLLLFANLVGRLEFNVVCAICRLYSLHRFNPREHISLIRDTGH